jgi:ipoprotein LpqH
MPNRIAVAAIAALTAAVLGACSSTPSQAQIASTATVTVNGNEARIQVVKCGQLEWYRTIDIGGDFSGVNIVIDERKPPLVALSVRIQNMGGFTGMYSKDDGGDANMSLSNEKYSVTGTANGFKTDKPGEPASATFKITATC